MINIMKNLDPKLWSMNIGISIFVILTILFLYPQIDTREDSIVESTQAILITLGMIVFAYHAFRSKERESKLVSFGLSLLALTFLLRELNVETFDIPSFLIMIGSGSGRNLLLVSLWIILLILTFKDKNFEKNKVVTFLNSTQGQLLMFSALMLVLGSMMDKNVFSLQYVVTNFYEELLELLGYVYLFFASILRFKR